MWNELVMVALTLMCLPNALADNRLCAVTTFFNPVKYTSRVTNFVHARHWSLRQGLQLLVVELAFDDEPFVLDKSDGDDLIRFIRLRGSTERNVMWQKEALINIGLARLEEYFPKCNLVTWIDADVVLEDGWVESAMIMLNETHNIGQPYTHLVRLPNGVFTPDSHWSEPRMRRMGFGNSEGQVQIAASVQMGGHTGYAWIARKVDLQTIGGLYSNAVVGGFDALMTHVLLDPRCETRFNRAMARDFKQWSTRSLSVFRNVTHPKHTVRAACFWHGDVRDRNYQDRHLILLESDFDPARHVRLDTAGLLEWTENAPCELKDRVLKMFIERREDGIRMREFTSDEESFCQRNSKSEL